MAGNKWQISDERWGKMAPLIPEHKTQPPLGIHRKTVDNRAVMNAIFFVLSTGRQWNCPECHRIMLVKLSHRHFQERQDAAVFECFCQNVQLVCEELDAIDWLWLSIDEFMTKSPLAGSKNRQ